jgi:hypothetical protein
MKQTRVPITSIYTNPAYMVRAMLNQEVIDEYCEAYLADQDLPALNVFKQQSGKYLVADGWHRYEAAKQAKLKTLPVKVFKGEREKVIAVALAGNKSHGLRRTNADKRICAEMAIETWPKLSNRQLGEAAGVSEFLIRDLRPKIKPEGLDTSRPNCDLIAPADDETPEKPHISQPTKENVPYGTKRDVPVKKSESGKPVHLLAIWTEIEGLYGKALNRLDELNRLCRNPSSHALLISGTKKLMVDLSGWRESVKKA